ncbi:hypothetical protein Tco_0791566 [Tanacetum coccineum]
MIILRITESPEYMKKGDIWCSDRRCLVRDANTIKVFFKGLIFEFCAVIGSYDDDSDEEGQIIASGRCQRCSFGYLDFGDPEVARRPKAKLGMQLVHFMEIDGVKQVNSYGGLLRSILILDATTLRRRWDSIILCIAPRLWPSGLSSVVYSRDILFFPRRLERINPKIPGAITFLDLVMCR